MSEEAFRTALRAVEDRFPQLPELESALLAALAIGLPGDSRAFARTFDVAHALVLRAVTVLESSGLVSVEGREPRTQRTRYTRVTTG